MEQYRYKSNRRKHIGNKSDFLSLKKTGRGDTQI